jgi:hypothetical protein
MLSGEPPPIANVLIPCSVSLTSPLHRAECVARLRAGVDSPWRVFGSEPIIGHVESGHAIFRRRAHWRGASRFCLDVTLLDDGATSLVCRPGPHPLLAMTAGGWFGILLTGGGLVAALAVAGGVHHFFWYLLAAPVVLFSVWTVTFALDRRDPADDHAFLIGQITRMTDAHPT